ncbi:MAG: TolC family protein [Nitrospirae bacterium]|nr:MAG: TolC family protein [Nitrospirota bacterium]
MTLLTRTSTRYFMTVPDLQDYSMALTDPQIKGDIMQTLYFICRLFSTIAVTLAFSLAHPPGNAWSLDQPEKITPERLQNNLDISISRQTKESRLTDIVFEQAKFDPTFSLNGQINRTVAPLNRPVFGGTGQNLNQITTFDQRNQSVTVDLTQNILTGGNLDLNYSPQRTNVNQSVASGFLFNPGYTGGLALTLTQPLLRNAGMDLNRTFIRIAQNNAKVEEHVFSDRVLTVIATVEQTYWEVVFANENLKVAQAALKAAEELLASNRAKAKVGVMSVVDVLQEQVLVAEKAIRDQEDQFRRLLNPSEEELRQDLRLVPSDELIKTMELISLQEALDIAIERRPEILQASKNVETSELNTKFAKNQLLPSLGFQGTTGLAGLGKDFGDMTQRNFGGDFYNWGAGLVLSFPIGNRSAVSQYNKRQLEARNAEATLQSVRKQIIVGVREAVRRVQTDFKRIETTRSARIMAEKQLQAERERLNVGLSTTRFVLDFQRDLATAQGNELRAMADYNKSLTNLARQKATTLERYRIELQ